MKAFIISFLFVFSTIFMAGTLYAEGSDASNISSPDAELGVELNSPGLPQQIFHSITGHIYEAGTGDPFEGVTISFSGGVGSVVSDTNGLYSVNVPRGWTGVASPSYCGLYDFTPLEVYYENVKKDIFDQDYIGAPSQLFTISGKFTHYDTGDPLVDTEIDLGNGTVITTNEFGEYLIEMLPCVTDTITPLLEGYNFTPASRNYQTINSDHPDQDYIATPDSFGLPPGWEYDNTGTVHIISVFTSSNPSLCGTPLQPGDYIGVFYTDDFGELKCGGAGMWTGVTNTPVIAQGDDLTTSEKDGFAYGETFTWKIYKWTGDQQEYAADPEFQCGGFLVCNNKWYVTGLSIIESMDVYKEQFIEIREGWSGFSSFLTPESPLVTHTMAPILDELVIMQTLTKVYYPGQNINTIGLWKTNSGYKIRVNTDVVLPIMGCPLIDTQLSLSSTWNLIPVISNCNVQLTELLAPVMDNIIVVKEIAGNNVYWPDMSISTLQTLLPGKAYMVAVSQNSQITFPDCAPALKAENLNANEIANKTSWNDPALTPSTHNIAIQAQALSVAETGDYIGAFTRDGYCAGLTQITDVSQNLSITIFGDDITTNENDGLALDEIMTFKLFRPSTNKEYKLWVSFDQNLASGNGHFADNGLSVIGEIMFDATGIDNQNPSQVRIFPNPSSGTVEIILGDNTSTYNVNIYSMTGSTVFTSTASGKTAINLGHLQKGIYLVKIGNEDFVKYEKLILE